MNHELLYRDHTVHYSSASFWKKLRRQASACGRHVVEKALWLYYAAQRPETPRWAKAVIVGALGYLVFPADAVPDILPMAGYSDDLAVLTAAVATIVWHITPDVRQQAERKLRAWFGDSPPND